MELGGLAKVVAENGVVAAAFLFLLYQQSKVIERLCNTLDDIRMSLVEITKDYQRLSDDVCQIKEKVNK